ncbi:MAG: DUF59 domain-containing protein [Planctomycetes bacterium]|nr:DUF59 domain-containing protein [Planctomycetota bacterium]
MTENRYDERTDSLVEKIQVLLAAAGRKDYRLAMSLAESVKDGLAFEHARSGREVLSGLDADFFYPSRDLPPAWSEWARGWRFFKAIRLEETAGLERTHEPVDIGVGFEGGQVADPCREVRVARVDAQARRLAEVPCQVYGEARLGSRRTCRVVFFAEAPAWGHAVYLLFFGNPEAELADYPTDLCIEGEGYGLDISNHYYTAQLSRQMGQLERLVYRKGSAMELFAAGEGHGEPPNIDWAHDYVASERFQKFRVTQWASCPNYEVVRGPLMARVRRWGFPHSPVHPIFTPARMHIDVTYTFYAGLPYFLKDGRMEMVRDLDIVYLRDDEWVFTGFPFTDTLWMDSGGIVHEGAVPEGMENDLWGVGFFNRSSRDAFVALWLEHAAEHFDGVLHNGAPTLDYMGSAQLWSRAPAKDNPHFNAGAALKQRNAYRVGPYPRQGGADEVQHLGQKLLHPLAVRPEAVPTMQDDRADGNLGRPGERAPTVPPKEALWAALREIKEDMLYTADASLVDLGYIYDVRVERGNIQILMTMPHRGRPRYRYFAQPIRERLLKLPGVTDVQVLFRWHPAWTTARLTDTGVRALGLDEEILSE